MAAAGLVCSPAPAVGDEPVLPAMPTPAATPSEESAPEVDGRPETGRQPIRIGGQLYAAYRLRSDEPYHEFVLRRARLGVYFEPVTWFAGQVELDLSSLEIKDAYGRIALWPWLEITAGHFKKPFSRLELTPPRQLALWRRGMTNALIVERETDPFYDGSRPGYGFGGRDLGVMVSGRAAGFGWAAGVFNGNGIRRETDIGKVGALRLTYRAAKWLGLGLSGAWRYRTGLIADGERPDIWGAGIDARFRLKPVDIIFEALWGQKGETPRGPQSLGVVLCGRGRFTLAENIQIEPVIKTELLDDNLWRPRDLAWSLTAGANLRLWKIVRVMLQGEVTLSEPASDVLDANGPDLAREEYTLILILAFDYKLDIGLPALFEP